MYKQTLMSKIEPAKGDNNPKKQVITPRKAIESLYFNRYLKAGDEVLDARLEILLSSKRNQRSITTSKLGNQSET